jgi:hypothetical protein
MLGARVLLNSQGIIVPIGSTVKTGITNLYDLAVDSNKNIYYIADTYYSYKITPTGTLTTYTSPVANSSGYNMKASSIHIDKSNNIFIGYYQDYITKNKIGILGNKRSVISGPSNGCSTSAIISYTDSIYQYNNDIYYTDAYNKDLFKGTVQLNGTYCSSKIGTLRNPVGSTTMSIAFDSSGNMYYTIPDKHIIRKYDITTNTSTDFCGSSGISGDVDANQLNSRFNTPTGLVCDSCGNLFVADNLNYKIKKITPNGDVITVVGTGINGTTDGPALSMKLNNPSRIVLDSSNNLYIGDGNRIRKVVGIGCV